MGQRPHLGEGGVHQQPLMGQAQERCGALGAPRVRRADGPGRLPAAWRQGRLLPNEPQYRPARNISACTHAWRCRAWEAPGVRCS